MADPLCKDVMKCMGRLFLSL